MMNLKYDLRCVAREIMLATFTDEMYLKYTDGDDKKIVNIMRDRMLLLTKLDTKVADLEMEAFRINDKETVDKCERMRHKIMNELKLIRTKYNL